MDLQVVNQHHLHLTCVLMSIVRSDLVSHCHPQFSSSIIQTLTGSLMRALGNMHICGCLSLLVFSHQMRVSDIVDEVILGRHYECLWVHRGLKREYSES